MNLQDGPLTLALAMLIGVVAQAAGRHARLPGIVLLLVAGVALGPDGANVIRPETMAGGLTALVGFAVAIILFEGGLSLRIADLRGQAKPIRRLVTVGAVLTGALAAVAAKAIMAWDWRLSILFGTLVIVTGPTVVTPMVRRLRLSARLTSILVAEGIFIDAIGATIAVVALEIAIAPSRGEAAAGVVSILLRFGVGAAVGAAGGAVIVGVLRVARLVPHGLENVMVLATTVGAFHISNAIVGESGITAAIVAGLVVGNVGVRVHSQIAEFNEALTELLIATLFVLLAADVRLDDVLALGWNGAWVVVALMLVVRPITVFASTVGTTLTLREKLYLSWIAPRGIVAAAVASLFAIELAHAGVPGGVEMRALVFVVIAMTVTLQGLSAGVVGSLLGVRKPKRSGYLILGANALARLLARTLRSLGERVVMIERAGEACLAARRAGFEVVLGDGIESATLEEAGIDSVDYAIGLTPNEHVNLLFARLIADDYHGPKLQIALERHEGGVTPAMTERHAIAVLFGAEHDLLAWLDRARQRAVAIERWRVEPDRKSAPLGELPGDWVLPLVIAQGGVARPVDRTTSPGAGDEVYFVVAAEHAAEGQRWLRDQGWIPVLEPEG